MGFLSYAFNFYTTKEPEVTKSVRNHVESMRDWSRERPMFGGANLSGYFDFSGKFETLSKGADLLERKSPLALSTLWRVYKKKFPYDIDM